MSAASPLPIDASSRAWLEGMERLIAELPPSTEDQRKRGALVTRLASVLSDEGPTGPGLDRMRARALELWSLDPEELQRQLDAWEAGRHPLQLAGG
jgi:hypothetical protein